MKQFYALIVAILCSTSIAKATIYTGDGWTADTDEGTLTINNFISSEEIDNKILEGGIAASIKTIIIEDKVTNDDLEVLISEIYIFTNISIWTVAEGNTAYSSVDGVLYNYDCTELISYPTGKTDTSYTIPESVTSIDSYAFRTCSSLTSVDIGSSVTSIGERAFLDCSSLISITVADGNTAYSSDDGVLYNYDKTELIQYPAGKTDTSFTIPDDVTSIGDYAFNRCTNLTSVTIPESVTSIGSYAFYYCSSLTSITIPESVTSIGSYAFYKCSSLTSVTCQSATPPSCGATPFSSSIYSKATLTAASNLYKYATYWKDFTTIEYTDDAQTLGTTLSGQCGDSLTYTLSLTEGTLVIEGSGDMYDYSTFPYAPWYAYSEAITDITISAGVTSISNYAFYYCSSLTSVTSLATTPPDVNLATFTTAYDSFYDIVFYVASCEYYSADTWSDTYNIYYSETGSCGDNLTYSFDSGSLTISGSGDMYNYASADDVPWSCMATRITEISIGSEVTGISDYAFYNCISISSITLPDAVTTIGKCAFSNCSSLSSIIIPDPVTDIGDSTFYYCSNLADVTIGNGVTSIGQYAFNHCTKLTSITIPDAVTTIGDYAFNYCSALTDITIGSSVTSIGDYAFNRCTKLTSVTIPDAVTTIGDYTFYYCSALTDITIGSGVTSIGKYAFYYCTSLTSVTSLATTPPVCDSDPFSSDTYEQATLYAASNLYKYKTYWKDFTTIEYTDDAQMFGTTLIGQCGDNLIYTFDLENGTVVIEGTGDMYDYDTNYSLAPWNEYSDIITSFSLPSGMTSVGAFAFYNCSSLTSIAIPDSVTYIGAGAFYNCYSLTSVDIPDGITSIHYATFYYCSSLESITIPNSVTYISSYVFFYCTSLTDITIPEGVTYIGSSAFESCRSLTSITIPDGITKINYATFWRCYNLESVTIPDGVTDMSTCAFYYCTSLTDITIPDGVTSIGYRTFYKCTSLADIAIPDNVTYIGQQAFYNCTSLTDITIPAAVTYIDDQAFYKCTGLTSVTSLATTPPTCYSEPFSSDTYEQATLYPASTDYATADYWCNFYNIVYIGGGSCGDNLKWYYSDGRLIIFGTGDMQSYSSADNVPWVGFASAITSVTIGSSVTSISNYAFSNCTNITTVTSYNTTAPTLSANTFDSTTYSSATLSVTSTAYVLADYWKLFGTKTIVDASTEEDYTVYDIFPDSNTAISDAVAAQSAIHASGNLIVIDSSSDQQVAVYSFDGQIIVKQHVSAGTTKIAMPQSGIYIAVLSDGTKAKILVK